MFSEKRVGVCVRSMGGLPFGELLLRIARQRMSAALVAVSLFLPAVALAQQPACPPPSASAAVGSLVLNPDTGTCFKVRGLLTYANAKESNAALDISPVANPDAVVYLQGEGNEVVLVQTAPAAFVFTLVNNVPSSQLFQVRSSTTVTGSPALVTGVSLYAAGSDPNANGAVFTPYDSVFAVSQVAGTTNPSQPSTPPTVTAGRVSLVYTGDSGGGGSNGYIFGSGGDGGDGATGPAVAVVIRNSPTGSAQGVPFAFTDPISTLAASTPGISVASVGGNGGSGGTAYSIYGNGGNGGTGGSGGTVSVRNQVQVATTGESSAALKVYSSSGSGGSAGAGGLIGGGGAGGAARNGGPVAVVNEATGVLRTAGEGAYGIQALSTGGAGGAGGGSFALVGLAGSAAGSGSGGAVEVINRGQVTTTGDRSYGVLAQSIGGSGGDGGNSGGLVAMPSDGAVGGDGSLVAVLNAGKVETQGVDAHGIVAQSIGGGGGSGGNAGGLVALAAAGGKSGNGGSVEVLNEVNGIVLTFGASSNAILAQSIGGGGGTGGASGGLVALSSTGGGAGSGGTVSVTNHGLLETAGTESRGIKAQSIGGGGGDGGEAGGLVALAGGGGGASPGGAVSVFNTGTIRTGTVGQSGAYSDAIFAQSVGGGGGEGAAAGGLVGLSLDAGGGAGDGGAVTVSSTGKLQTLFDDSYGIFAQSIGGGGGAGGEAGGLVALAGDGGGAGAGGAVSVSNGLLGDIVTTGARSGAIFAQSVGGGGGNGSPSGGIVALSGSASTSGGGNGGAVTVANRAVLTTFGTVAKGIFAQSVGGGGGAGGESGGLVALSGSGGGAGNGGAVTVTNSGQIFTGQTDAVGSESAAIFAQSVGGGGGEGAASGGIVALGSSGGGAGNGGDVAVTNSGHLQTLYDDSFGIFAESVGGGGGAGGESGGLVALSGDGGGAGTGGAVTVNNAYDAALNPAAGGAITTTGARSTAIFAHSIGGGGGYGTASGGLVGIGGNAGVGNDGGAVVVKNDAVLTTLGTAAKGIFAQSVGGGGGAGGESGGLVALSGDGGGSGNGGTVTVTNAGQILTGKLGVAGSDATAIYAQSVGGGGGVGVASGGIVALGSAGGGAGNGGDVAVTNSAVLQTLYADSFGIFAQSVGGGGGAGGASGGLVALAGTGGGAGYGGAVRVNNLPGGNITTFGDNSAAIYAQSVGGGGGSGGLGGGLVGIGGASGTGTNGGAVTVNNAGDLTTHGVLATAIHAQSIGGGGGDGGEGGGLFTFGGAGAGDGTGAKGGAVTVSSRGNLTVFGNGSMGIFAESVGGGGGSGGAASGVVVTVGGKGGLGSDGGLVQVAHGGVIQTAGTDGFGIYAQSVGGGGGVAGVANSGSLFFGMSIGGDGGAAGRGGDVNLRLDKALANGLLVPSLVLTENDRSTGIFAQSVGGGGGSGGKAIQGSAGAFINVSVAVGGKGGAGGEGGTVTLAGAGNVITLGDVSPGVVIQSVGGGGGNGGSTVSASLAVGEGVSLAGAVALGGAGASGGDGGAVRADIDTFIGTSGAFSTGFLAQSVGGGGGNGGSAIAAAASFSDGVAGAAGVGLGGSGSLGGVGGTVSVALRGAVSTGDAQSDGIVVQSVGGGGGNAGLTVAASLAAAGGGAGNLGVGLGGSGGAGGNAGDVVARITADVHARGDGSDGVVVQAVGGGGGNSGLTVGAGAAGSLGGAASVNVGIGGSGGAAGDGGTVNAYYSGDLSTFGNNAIGILAQSVGGGGGNSGGTIAAGLSVAGGVAGSVDVAIGGDGGGGGAGGKAGVDLAVTLQTAGSVATNGINSSGIVAQSIGGGGGNGGYSVAGGAAAALEGVSGTIGVGLGGKGAGGGVGKNVLATLDSSVVTRGDTSMGVLVQSVGGGGGNGGLNVTAGLSGAAVIAANVAVGLGGNGGAGNIGGRVDASATGPILTLGTQSHGFVAQSVGGGGGNGGGNVAASLGASGVGVAGGVNVGLGGNGGTGADGGLVVASTQGTVATYGAQSVAILAQSVGGGGGNGAFNVAAGLAASAGGAAAIDVGLGGHGSSAGNGGEVRLTVNNAVFTFGADASGIIAQSLGGGGGNGGLNVAASGAAASTGSVGISVGLGGDGASGGNGGKVTLNTAGQVATLGRAADGILAQSVGGGGGNGGINVAGTISGAGVGNGSVTVGLGGSGALGGTGADVELTVRGPVSTVGASARGVIAQSLGGGGGNGAINVAGTLAGAGTGSGDVTVAIGGKGGGGGASGRVSADVVGNIVTNGDFADGLIVQTIGGGGGNSAITVGAAISGAGVGNGSAKISLGGAGGAGGSGNVVVASYAGAIDTVGDYSRGMLAQSVGGGGGSAGGNIAAGLSGATTGSGDVAVGIGGAGGSAGDGGLAGTALAVTASASGQIVTRGDFSGAFIAQSVGGGGGSGGFNVAASGSGAGTGAVGVGVGLGGDGSGGGNGKGVLANVQSNIWTYGNDSTGVLAQSVGGGGGNGGFNVTAAATFAGVGAGNVSVGLGGSGAKGGGAGAVEAHATGTIATLGSNSAGFVAQSIGGGGGNGGFNVAVSVAAGIETGSGAVGVGLGGDGDEGGSGGDVIASTAATITTQGDNAAGVLAQSIGGGGGNGGFTVAVGAAGGGTGSGSAAVGLGGAGAGGGAGASVSLSVTNDVLTQGKNSAGVIAQSVGGGGGNGGFDVTVPLSFAGTGSGAVSVGLGGSGAGGGNGGVVVANGTGEIRTAGQSSTGLLVQSVGGGGGNGGFSVAAAISGAGKGSVAGGISLGGTGAGGGSGAQVTSTHTGTVVTSGEFSTGVVVQSVGGGGGNGGFSVAAAISGAKTGSGALSVGLGGSGGAGNSAGAVSNTQIGNVLTFGASAGGVLAQSVGGGGGNGGFAVSGSISIAGDGSGAIGVGLGGSGGTGGAAGAVTNTVVGNVLTEGEGSFGVIAQSLGGGGGTGGLNITGTLVAAKKGAGSLGLGIGGTGGIGGTAADVSNTVTGIVRTTGNGAKGVFTQSLGGGGGAGGMNVTGSISASKDGSGNLAVGIGGFGGEGGVAGSATSTFTGSLSTAGNSSIGILTQSTGGGGGDGAINVTGTVNVATSGAGGNLGVGVGGFGASGGDAGLVVSRVTALDRITTQGDQASAVMAQSIGGGGGNGALNITGAFNFSAKSGGTGAIGVGGFGGGAGNGKAVTLDVSGLVVTNGSDSHGLVAQSVGGGGGAGGMNISGSIAVTKASTKATQVGVAIGVGGFGGGGGTAGDVTLTHAGSVYTAQGLREFVPEAIDPVTGAVIPAYDRLKSVPGVLVPEEIVAGERTPAYYLDQGGFGSHGIVAQSIGGGGGAGGTNVSGSISAGFGTSADAYGIVVGVGGFGGAGGDAGNVKATVTGGEMIATAGRGRSGMLVQSIGGGGGDGGTNITGSISTDAPLLVGVGGFGANAGLGKNVDVNVAANINVLGADNTAPDEDDQKHAAGIMAQSIGGGGGNGGLNVTGGLVWSKEKGIPSINVGIGGFGGAGAASGAVNVAQVGSITTSGSYTHGILAQSIGGGGGNGAMNIGGQLNGADSEASGGKTDVSIIVGVGGNAGDAANSGAVSVTQSGQIVTQGNYARGIFAQSVGGGGGVGGMNVTAIIAKKSAPVSVGVGGSGSGGGTADTVTVLRGSSLQTAGAILTGGDYAHGIEASSIGGGGGDAGMNFNLGYTGAGGTQQDPNSFAINAAIGGAGGVGSDGKAATVVNHGDILTVGAGSHGILAQSIGGGGGNANFNIALSYAGANTSPPGSVGKLLNSVKSLVGKPAGEYDSNTTKANQNKGFGLAVGGATGDGGDGGNVDVVHRGNIRTAGANSYGILSQSIGGGGGNAGMDIAFVKADGGKAGVTIGRHGGTGGVGGDVTLDSSGEIRTIGSHSFGLLAQSIGNGGGNSSSTSVAAEFPTTNADKSITANTFGVAIGLEGGIGGHAGNVVLNAKGLVATEGDRSHAIFAQSVGGGGGNGGAASVAGITAGTKFAMGGTGGTGGYGGQVHVVTSAQVQTLGTQAVGVLAQSIGGGGGDGGAARGGGLKSGNQGIDVLLGGDGGTGMTGGLVRVDNSGVIITRGIGSHGVLAQSLGGGGGNSGMTIDVVSKASADSPTRVAVLVGGTGGEGATGGEVIVTNTGGIGTEKAGAVGIFAQSIGGKGGNAELVMINTVSGTKGGNNLSLALGGSGGVGAAGGAVTVSNLPTVGDPSAGIITLGGRSHGIFAMSLGGGGGTGASSVVVSRTASSTSATTINSLSLAMGGTGGVGGVGGTVTVNNASRIVTFGDAAHGILAQSIGGGGGNGGKSVIGATAVGTTKAAQSVGGISNKELSIGVALGGVGGSGNTGGTVTVNNSGFIDVSGDRSYGIYAQSVGGGGGDGGLAITLSKDLAQKQDLAATLTKFALGGAGGDGADGGAVTVKNTGTIIVRGKDGYGIFAQSVGGGGGNTGASISSPVWIAGALVMDQLLGARDGTTGKNGLVDTKHKGDIILLGDGAQGVFEQSVNGGGGSSEMFLDISQQAVTLGEDGYQLPDNSGDVDKAKAYVTGLIKQGADAIKGSVVADALVDMSGSVMSLGNYAVGVLAQAVGGGGGSSSTTVRYARDGGQTVDLTAALGGTTVADSSGGQVDYTQEGVVYQQGDASLGTVVQSVGGGGGKVTLRVSGVAQVPVLPPAAPGAAKATPGVARFVKLSEATTPPAEPNVLTLAATLGGVGGTGNDGRNVTMVRTGAMQSVGDHSTLLVGQSIGGGGGQLVTSGLTGLSVALGGTLGNAGNGGDVSLTNTGAILTAGAASNGVLLQSIGGGGGVVLSDTAPSAVVVTTNADNVGNGGKVTFHQTGGVEVLGANAYGIILQSLGGGGGWVDNVFAGTAGGVGLGGAIDLAFNAGVYAPGAGSVAVKVQSLGSLGGGNINIAAAGHVRGNAAAIEMEGGANNLLTSTGSLSAVSAQAITATSGNDTVRNTGLIVGNVDLGSGTNTVLNEAGATFVAISKLDLRDGLTPNSVFINKGEFLMGLEASRLPLDLAKGATFSNLDNVGEVVRNVLYGTRVINTVALDGNFQQTASGHMAFDIAYGPYASDRVNVTGTATVAGKGDVVLTWLENHQDILLFATGAGGTNQGLEIADTLALDFSVLGDAAGIHLQYKSQFGTPFLNRNGKALGRHMDSALLVGGANGIGRLMALIGNLQAGQEGIYSGLFRELNPEPLLSPMLVQFETANRFSKDLFGCTDAAALPETGCGWTQASNQSLQRRGDFEAMSVDASGFQLAGGFERPLDGGWSLAGALQYDSLDHVNTDGRRAMSGGDGLHLGLGARQVGDDDLAVAISLTAGWQWMQTLRQVTLFTQGLGQSKTQTGYVQTEVNIGRGLRFGRMFARPSLTAAMTAMHQSAFTETGLEGNGVVGVGNTDVIASVLPQLELGILLQDEPTHQSSLVLSAGGLLRSSDRLVMPFRLMGTQAASAPAEIATEMARRSYRLALDLSIFANEQFALKLGHAMRSGGGTTSRVSHMSLQWKF